MTTDAETTRARSGLYGLLAAAFRAEPTAALLREMAAPAVRGAMAAVGAAPETDADADVEALAVEYARLFIGPGDHVAPYASVHLGGDGASLWGEKTAWVKNFIEDAGFDYRPDYHGLPDHIAVELEFMQAMTAEEAAALEKGDGERAARIRRAETAFVTEHLATWAPAFCRQVIDRAELPFYRALARVTAGFIASEAAELAADAA